MIDYKPKIDNGEGALLDPKAVSGHIRMEDVHFRYPSRPGVRVLRDLTLDVPPGTYVALVGPSGCGKSTTIQLLERFYDPLVGKVTLDGVDIRDLNVASYRSQIALVSQEPTLYAGTVRFNILLGANKPIEEVTEEELVKACKEANIVSAFAIRSDVGLTTVRFHHVFARSIRDRGRRKRFSIVWWSG